MMMKTRKTLIAAAVVAALAIGSTQLFADPPQGSGNGPGGWGGWGYGMGPGMMGGWGGGYGMGPGMMGGWGGGYGPGYGMGPGMMGGWGGGYGPGYGMGPGMMYGYGPGYGMGPGMMYGYGPYGAGLNLTDEQRSKISKIQEDFRSKQWDLMGKMHDAYAHRADAADDAAANKADDQITQLQQQMIGNAAAARKQMDAVLTKEQRQRLRRGEN
jgi:Spy/CpxP family protein refolding chaperone